MSKKLVEKASEFRDQIQELEGLLVGKSDGTVIWGDTLRDLNHEFILSSASLIYRATKKLSQAIDKKEIQQIDAEMDEGYATIMILKDTVVVGFIGNDAKSQLAIIKQNLKLFAEKIKKLV
jgi:predicted regulator of Ras-like GTPase activity (Roadblock/LC7/MglB family)